MTTIRVRYNSVDHFSESRAFKTIEGARRYAQRWVGMSPELSHTFQYAVSGDGMGKVSVRGASIYDLFPESEDSDS